MLLQSRFYSFWALTNVRLLQKLVMRKLEEGSEMYRDSIYSLSNLRELRDKGWKTCSGTQGWEPLLSSEMSVSQLKDHLEMALCIAQVSVCYLLQKTTVPERSSS